MNCKFELSVLATIKKHALLAPHDRVIASVSGGADSMALLHFLHSVRSLYELSIFCIHINHGIRGDEGMRDADRTAERALEYGIPVRILNFDVPSYAEKKKLSLEEAGRIVRYSLLEKHGDELGATRIATGHTRNDQVETVLMRILRGTGPTGLRAIQARRDSRLIRPLIAMTRESVTAYLREAGLSWCCDSTNFSWEHLRNRVRHHLLPLLKNEYNPSVEENLCDLGELASGDEEVLERLTDIFFRSLATPVCGGVSLACSRLRSLPRGLQRRVVRRAFSHARGDLAGLSFAHVEQALDLMERYVGCRIHLPGGMVAQREYSMLHIGLTPSGHYRGVEVGEHVLSFPGKTEIREINGIIVISQRKCTSERFSSSRRHIYLDRDLVSLPLRVRKRRNGDRFVPFGMTGEKKIKEFFIDEKVPREKRDKIPIIVDNEERVVWIVGYRMDNRVRVTEASREIVSISFIPSGQGQGDEPFPEESNL